MILTLIICAVGIWFIYDLFVEGRHLPPGPLRLPLIGNILQMARQKKKEPAPHKMLQTFCKEYGPIITLQYGMKRQVIIDDYVVIKQILASDTWLNRPTDEWMMERSFGKQLGILWANGDSWREVRRFSIRTLRDFGFGKQKGQDAAMQEELNELMERLDNKLAIEGGSEICMSQFFTVSVLNILWSMMAGTRFMHDDLQLQQLVKHIYDNTRFINATGNILMAYPLLRSVLRKLTGVADEKFDMNSFKEDTIIRFGNGVPQNILNQRRALGEFMVDQLDFIDVFLNEIEKNKNDKSENNVFTDEQFITVALDLFVAGSETTSNSLEFAMLFMILYPKIQEKVKQEIDTELGRSAFPTAATMRNKMPYTEAVLLEIQRISSVAPMVVRSPSSNQMIGAYTIPQGTFTILNLYSAHMNSEVWDNPCEFRPERFLNAKNEIVNSDKIFPFGQGKRVCMGEVLAKATLFTFFVRFLQNYTLEVSPHRPPPATECVPGLTLAPQPFFALIKKRTF